MTWIKVCGVTRVSDAAAAADVGVDAVGLIFVPGTKRHVDLATAAQIVAALPDSVLRVGVFMDQTRAEVEDVLAHVPLSTLQFHGSESRAFMTSFGRPVIQGIPVASRRSIADARQIPRNVTLLFDGARPGSGGRIDPELLDVVGTDLLAQSYLAGGLDPDNVGQVVCAYRPGGVDVATGIEAAAGVKDVSRMADFVMAVREAAA